MTAFIQNHLESGVRAKTARKLPEKNHVASFSKSDARYWLQAGRLFKEHGCPHYYCRFSAKGTRARFALDTSNQKTAAAKAAEIYREVIHEGWEIAMARLKPMTVPEPPKSATVGALIEVACDVSSARRQSLGTYSKAFRRIVSEVMAIDGGRKYDALKGGTAEWRAKVDAVPLTDIQPVSVQEWKNRRLRSVENDPVAKRHAIVTVNSLIRNAKALFGKKVLPFVEQRLSIPRPLPFEGVSLEKGPSLRYVSKIDAYAILARGKEELAALNKEAYKVLLLALVCGLRRSEIDHLLWQAFDFQSSILRVENSEFHQLKSEDSAGEIDLDADIAALFKRLRSDSPTSMFVIENPNRQRRKGKSLSYRCDAVFNNLNVWLRTQGVESLRPLHTLRKEIGSIIASEHGIFEASRYLRHSDIRITSAFYVDKKKTVTPKAFAGLLE